MQEGDHKLLRAAGSMSVMTMLSRVAGYFRDRLQAQLLGAAATYSGDAFVIAYRIPNLLRRLVAEGALTSAFVPTFTRYMKRGDDAAMWRFAASVGSILTAVLGILVVGGVLMSPLIVHGLAWGYGDTPGKIELTVALNRVMWPYIFFISLSALAAAILNAFGSFALPAFTPVLLNLSIIGCGLLFRHSFRDPAFALATGVLVGGVLQLVIQLPALLRHGFRLEWPRPLDRDGVREVGRLMLPRLFGVGITQINLVVDSQFATSLREGSASFLYYANRVTELTLGVFGISLSTVILPTLSKAAVEGDREGVLRTLSTAMRLLLFVTIPATTGLVLLRMPIIHVLFENGKFGADDTRFTAEALACYSLGLLPYAAVNVLATAFYAHRDTRTPVKVGLATFGLHLGLNFALRGPLQHSGIALSTALSAFVDAALLGFLLRRRYGEYLDQPVRACLLRTVLGAGTMAGTLLLLRPYLDPFAHQGFPVKLAFLLALITSGWTVYILTALVTGSGELKLVTSAFLRRRGGS
ncbi:MAG TPA: murein biosynthesis integral membrane protein MurJ [Candidatus Polarisedimenticolia bacterium]|nr:murein biosynthesis integral membrane protein MurJ [Candidatus Polarisedimenticolia bacterium]